MSSRFMKRLSTDVAILGSGFAGSLLALVLHRLGIEAVLLDRQAHPRFAIGESSTPLANMALGDISRKYDLARLAPLSRYGTWIATYPHVMRGLKRGFSYFQHVPGCDYVPSADHKNELLVAASASDGQSDTHWLRADVDAFFAGEAKADGVPLLERVEIVRLDRSERGWLLEGRHEEQSLEVAARFVIDGSGEGLVLAKALGIANEASTLKTHSRALYAHFAGIRRWREMLAERNAVLEDHPFNCDRAALHQVLDGAWMWQLRFDNEIVSAGFAIDPRRHPLDESLSPQEEWDRWMERYPVLREQFAAAEIVAPQGGLRRTGRMQRLLAVRAGANWAMLPHTAGFIDPLQSTGIVHSLFGIEKLVRIFEDHRKSDRRVRERALAQYANEIDREVRLIDTFVAGCYVAMPRFDLFSTMCLAYFAATVTCERRRQSGGGPLFLGADDPRLVEAAGRVVASIAAAKVHPPASAGLEEWRTFVRQTLAPYDPVGLFDPKARNMFRHTAATF
jgi:FADH2 O2-dependent halogenase